MSIYKAHKPILEVVVPNIGHSKITDLYRNLLWVPVDVKKDNKNRSVYGYTGDWQGVKINFKNVYKKTPYMRAKLTNNGQRCKIFNKYRRPLVCLCTKQNT